MESYFVGKEMSTPEGKERIAKEDILCYLNVEVIDKKSCRYGDIVFHKGIRKPKKRALFYVLADNIFIKNSYYSKSHLYNVNAEFIIPAGTYYYRGKMFSEYSSETIIFKRYIENEFEKRWAGIYAREGKD